MKESLVRYAGTAAGKVQGVGFRFFVQQNALELKVTGWVRNMEDGTVTMELQGKSSDLDELIGRIRAGNFFIKVENFWQEACAAVPEEKGFQIRY